MNRVNTNNSSSRIKLYITLALCLLLVVMLIYRTFYDGTTDVLDNTSVANITNLSPQVTPYEDSFTRMAREREEMRANNILEYDSVINGENISQAIRDNAAKQKLKLLANMESESTIEGTLLTKGFEAVIATIHDSSINVIIRRDKINEQEAAQILELVMRETEQSASNIKIIPTK